MFISKISIPRRTFLRGAGAAIALPFLDAMVPALSSAVARAATSQKRVGFVYIPHGVIMGQWTPAAEGANFEFTPILKPLEPYRDSLVVVSGLTRVEANSNHAVSSGCWLTGDAAEADGRSGLRGRRLGRSGHRQAYRAGHDVPVTRGRDRRLQRARGRLRPGLQLRLHEHAELADADDAAADGDQSASRVRAPVRRWWHAGTASRAHAHRSQPARLRGRRSEAHRRRSADTRSRATRRVSELHPGDRAAHRTRREAGARAAGRAERAGGRARGLRRARRVDVRPAGARIPGGSDACLHLHDGARSQPADVSRDRRDRTAPLDLASRKPARRRSRGTRS